MPRSKSFHLGQLLGQNSTIEADKLAAGAGGGGVTTYATAAVLPLSGNAVGDQAFVNETGRLYIFTGTGWYNIALINTNPTITSGANASYNLSMSGTPTVLTLVANDPEGVPITWSYAVTSGSLTNGGGTSATVTQVGNEFTITPTTNQAYEGVFGITFTASDGVNLATSASTFSLLWFSASGGTESTYILDGITYKVHTFTSSGTFTVTGLTGTVEVEYLVVGGGAGGGNNGGGGGGAGGFLTNTLTIPGNDVCSVVIGSGGAGAIGGTSGTAGGNGGSSSFSSANAAWSSIVAIGGGGGSNRDGGANAGSGGSGGGGAAAGGGSQRIFPGLGTAGQGFKGGSSNNSTADGLEWAGDNGVNGAGGGGGGAGQAGERGQLSPSVKGGDGGDGLASSITGSSVYYAGGGAGGIVVNGLNGNGGLGGGGGPAGAAVDNSGGGGAGWSQPGGSGIVIIRYVV